MNLVNEGVLPPNELDDRDERREEREVAQERETPADIVAEYRNDADAMDRGKLYQPTTEYVRRLLDRIEAAWKRERDGLVYAYDPTKAGDGRLPDGSAYALEAMREPEMDSHAVGNVAAMRDALVSIAKVPVPPIRIRVSSPGPGIIIHEPEPESEWLAMLRECVKRANAALSAPLRNCDVGTAEEQAERHSRFCISQGGHCKQCPAHRRTHNGCVLAWAQMPYAEEGGAK